MGLEATPWPSRTNSNRAWSTFLALISELHLMGYGNSKFVSLEEQLAISLYACVTGLTIHHVGERFQHANETISK